MKHIKIASLIIISIFLCTGCAKHSPEEYEKDTDPALITGTGVLEYPDENIHFVSLPIGGFLKKLLVKSGDSVTKGDAIAILESPEYLDMQIEYLRIKHELEYLREDFKRQGELTIDNVTSIKNMQKAQAGFLSKESICNGLEKKLFLIGINPGKLLNTGPSSSIVLKSKINGKIIFKNIFTGQYIPSDLPVFKIIHSDSLIVHITFDITHFNDVLKTDTVSLFLNDKNVGKALIDKHSVTINDYRTECFASIYSTSEYFTEGFVLKSIIKK